MVINLNPAHINIQTGNAGRAGVRTGAGGGRSASAKPAKAQENFIPEPESLATFIRSAVAALRQGMVWDRGTMLNILA